MILVIDNYDSFTYNLVHLLYALTPSVVVRRNREIGVEEAVAMRPEAIVLSPGPGRPEKAGIMLDLIRRVFQEIPLLGVCLGHQAIGQALGGRVVGAREIMHGKTSDIFHDGRGLFEGLENPFRAVRYHSLALQESSLPSELEVTARTADGEIMGIRHRRFPVEGIQYHPESVLTETGSRQLANFVNMARSRRPGGLGGNR